MIKRSPTLEERIYRAVRRHMMPYKIFPDPKPAILKAIRRTVQLHPKGPQS